MAVRAWLGTLLGGILVVVALTFFVMVALRDAALLRNGVRVTATVVDVKPAAVWNLFDYGRLVVQYPAPGSTVTREIWLDDSARMQPVGSTLTVLFAPDDPGRVRSLRDPNDPVPWGQWVLLSGVAGLVALIVGGRGVIHARDVARYPPPAVVGHRSPVAPVRAVRQPVLRGVDVPDVAPHVPADGGNAWDHPATRSQWNGYLLRSALLGALALGMAVPPVEQLRVVAATVALFALCAVGRAAWWRYILASGPWQRWSAIQSTSGSWPTDAPILLLTAAAAPSLVQVEVTVRLAVCNRLALQNFAILEGTVLFLPGRGHSGLLLLETGSRPFTTRLPLSERQWGRWRTVEFEPGQAG